MTSNPEIEVQPCPTTSTGFQSGVRRAVPPSHAMCPSKKASASSIREVVVFGHKTSERHKTPSQAFCRPCLCGLLPTTASRLLPERDATAPPKLRRRRLCPSLSSTSPLRGTGGAVNRVIYSWQEFSLPLCDLARRLYVIDVPGLPQIARWNNSER